MEQINFYQLLIFLLQGLMVSSLVLFLLHLRKLMGLAILYTALGLFQFLQVFFIATVSVEIFEGVLISPGSNILFSCGLFAVLLVYILEDAYEARKIIYALIIANLIMTALLYSFGWNSEKIYLIESAGILLVGTIVLFLDAVLMIILYENVSKFISNLFLRICITMILVLSFDAILFSIGAFWDSDGLSAILFSGLLAKNILAIFLSIVYTIYLKYIEKATYSPNFLSVYDIFDALSYKQKFKKIEEAIEISEKRYQTLTTISPVGIFLTNTEGNITFVNPSWSKISGIPLKGAINNKWFEHIHPDDREALQKKWTSAISKKEAYYDRFRFVHKDGSVIWGLSQLIPEFDKTQKNIGFVGTLTNITEMVQYEEEFRKEDGSKNQN